jgi:hypothetical protein
MCTGVVVRPCQKMLEAAEQLRVSGHHRVADAENFAKLRQSPVPEGEPANPDTGYVARRSFAPVIRSLYGDASLPPLRSFLPTTIEPGESRRVVMAG